MTSGHAVTKPDLGNIFGYCAVTVILINTSFYWFSFSKLLLFKKGKLISEADLKIAVLNSAYKNLPFYHYWFIKKTFFIKLTRPNDTALSS